MPSPSLGELLRTALRHESVELQDLRVYTRLSSEDPDLDYCITWGGGRCVFGTLQWWPDIQRCATDQTKLFTRFDAWRRLIWSICSVEGRHHDDNAALHAAADRRLARIASSVGLGRRPRESDEALRNRLINAIGGDALEGFATDPRLGLEEEGTPAESSIGRLEFVGDRDLFDDE